MILYNIPQALHEQHELEHVPELHHDHNDPIQLDWLAWQQWIMQLWQWRTERIQRNSLLQKHKNKSSNANSYILEQKSILWSTDVTRLEAQGARTLYEMINFYICFGNIAWEFCRLDQAIFSTASKICFYLTFHNPMHINK